MANIKLMVIAAAAVIALPLSARPVARVAVFPRSAQGLAPISLSDLIVQAIPKGQRIEWDALQIPAVHWLSAGIETSQTGWSQRKGEARVRAGNQTARILRQRWEELAWSIELSSEDLPKWGARSIIIKPGFDGAYGCFGTGFEGCDFPVAALNGPKLTLRRVCSAGPGSNRSQVFVARTLDGRTATVVYNTSAGSGGSSSSVQITTEAAEAACAEAARDE